MNKSQWTIKELLDIIRNKGAAWQSTYRTEYHMSKIKALIHSDDYINLSVALNHYRLGQGAWEFYDICKYIEVKYINE